jgi:hypothetical protein
VAYNRPPLQQLCARVQARFSQCSLESSVFVWRLLLRSLGTRVFVVDALLSGLRRVGRLRPPSALTSGRRSARPPLNPSLPLPRSPPRRRAKTVTSGPGARPLDASTVYSAQIMLSKFEYDGGDSNERACAACTGVCVHGGPGRRWRADFGLCSRLGLSSRGSAAPRRVVRGGVSGRGARFGGGLSLGRTYA